MKGFWSRGIRIDHWFLEMIDFSFRSIAVLLYNTRITMALEIMETT